ncbi:MAG: BON domain-containing protein [Rhodospirillaceae bacterium]|nr:BON domain-containing protein [Rhodospirillaceae bacterium]MBT6405535.1 BON domain-containing protein [Rhodospirillaceae bacterium]MBT6537014.1 BON domain-containing protein [Rhodospirillaceae bacterium]MBT7362354.1 BON domain-containing protein [Rhodospirillaceae bacterium]
MPTANIRTTFKGRLQNGRLAAALAVGLLVLAACTPAGVVVGGAASAGVAASEERGIKGAANDTLIRVAINEAWVKEDFDTFNRLELQIYEGRVLVSGRVPDQALADKAIQSAWSPKGVREVINEIEISEGGGIKDFANDTLINARLDADLLFDGDVDSINYSTRAIGGTVYLLGVAQDRAELDRVFRIARDIPNVKRVISHVIMIDDPRRIASPGGASDSSKPAASR